MSRLAVFNRIGKERDRQDRVWGREPGDWPVSDGMKLAILGEEYGEVARAMCEEDPEQLEHELVHLAACVVCWLEAIEAERKTS